MSMTDLEPGEDWDAVIALAPPPTQPSHAEILRRLAAMRPAQAETPRSRETFEQIARRMLSWRRPEVTHLEHTAEDTARRGA